MSAIGTPNAGTVATAASGNTSLAVSYPTTTTAGTTLLLSFSTFAAGTTVTTPSGWTVIAHVGSTGDTLPGNVNLYSKIADGTEGGGSLTVSHTSAACRAQIIEFAAVDPDTQLDVAAVTLDQTTAGVTNVSLPLPTTVSDDCTLVYVITDNTATHTATPPSGYTELADGGANCGMEIAYLQAAPIGAHSNVTVVMSGAGKQVAIAVALRPVQTVPAITPRRPWFPQWLRSRRPGPQPLPVPVVAGGTQALPAQPGRARDMMRVGWLGRRRGHEFVVPPIAYHSQKLPPQPARPRDMMRVGWIGRRRGHEFVVPPIAYHPQKLPPQTPVRRSRRLLPLVRRTVAVILTQPATPTTQALPPQPSSWRRPVSPKPRPRRRVVVPLPTPTPPLPSTDQRRVVEPPWAMRRRRSLTAAILGPAPAPVPQPAAARCRVWLPRLRRFSQAVVPAPVVTTQALPPQPRTGWRPPTSVVRPRRVRVANVPPVLTIQVLPPQPATGRRRIMPRPRRRLYSTQVYPFVAVVPSLPGLMALTDVSGGSAAADARAGSATVGDQRTGSGGAGS